MAILNIYDNSTLTIVMAFTTTICFVLASFWIAVARELPLFLVGAALKWWHDLF